MEKRIADAQAAAVPDRRLKTSKMKIKKPCFLYGNRVLAKS